MHKKSLAVGFLVGFCLGAGTLAVFVNRYEVKFDTNALGTHVVVKFDRWTGRATLEYAQ